MPEVEKEPQVEHGGALSRARRQYGGDPGCWLDLSTGINPNPVSMPDIGQSAWSRLPDEDLELGASKAAADYFGLPQGILPLCVPGTQSIIQRLPGALPGNVAIFAPTYQEYRLCFTRAGRTVHETSDFGLLAERGPNVVIVNPNNPDGRAISSGRLLALEADVAALGGYLIVDEAFAEAAPGTSVSVHAGSDRRLVVLRSFGKFFGLAGLRIGFVIAPEPVLSRLRNDLGPWAVSGPALSIATAVLSDKVVIERTRSDISRRRAALSKVIATVGLEVIGGTDLFALVRVADAHRIHHRLCGHRILVRKFENHPDWLRIGLAPDSNADARLLEGLKRSIAAQGKQRGSD